MAYVEFKNRWSGNRVDYDHVFSFQCVDLILQYIYEVHGIGSGVWGNAIDYAKELPANAKLREKFDLLHTTDCQQGDIVVLNGLAGNPYGHIGLCDSQTATTVRLLEQNAAGGGTGTGRDAIGVYRDIDKGRIAGVLRQKAAPAAAPVNAPTSNRSSVFLPSSAGSWRLYRVGSGLRRDTSDQIDKLRPDLFPPGLTYKIVAWVGDYAVVIDTQMFGRGVIWLKGTEAVIK